MKPKKNPTPHCKPVSYRWSSNGIICTGHTVLMATTRAGLKAAERRFFALNTHVQEAA